MIDIKYAPVREPFPAAGPACRVPPSLLFPSLAWPWQSSVQKTDLGPSGPQEEPLVPCAPFPLNSAHFLPFIWRGSQSPEPCLTVYCKLFEKNHQAQPSPLPGTLKLRKHIEAILSPKALSWLYGRGTLMFLQRKRSSVRPRAHQRGPSRAPAASGHEPGDESRL